MAGPHDPFLQPTWKSVIRSTVGWADTHSFAAEPEGKDMSSRSGFKFSRADLTLAGAGPMTRRRLLGSAAASLLLLVSRSARAAPASVCLPSASGPPGTTPG